MPRSINEMHQVPLNPFEALKRFYVSRGYIPRYFRKAAELEVDTSDKEAAAKKIKQEEDKRRAKENTERARLKSKARREEPSDGYEKTESQSKLEEKQGKDRAKAELEEASNRELEPESDKAASGLGSSALAASQAREEAEAQQSRSEEKQMKMDKKFDENPMLATLDEGAASSRRQKKEAAKEIVSEEKIHDVKASTEDVLYEAETVFPFTLFPDTLKLDREKLTMARRDFFRTAQISSVPLSEIMSIEANVGPFFGSVHLIFRFFNDNEKSFTFLKRQDAINLQRLVHGFIIAHRKGIDITKVPTKELRDNLVQIGQGVND